MSDKPTLTQAEAIRLLQMLKSTLQDYINYPDKGKSVEFDVKGDTKKDLFTIKIYRGKINPNKHEISARIKKDGVMLLELHVSPGKPHMNPDGQKIIGSHWHIYSEEYYRHQAYPATDITAGDFVDSTLKFLERFNVVDQPIINYQTEMTP